MGISRRICFPLLPATDDNGARGLNKFQNTITVRVSGHSSCETLEYVIREGRLFFFNGENNTFKYFGTPQITRTVRSYVIIILVTIQVFSL